MIHFKGRREGSHFQGHKRPRTIALLSNIGFQDLTVTPDAANGKDRDLIRLHYHLISREYRTVCVVMYWLHYFQVVSNKHVKIMSYLKKSPMQIQVKRGTEMLIDAKSF